MFLALHFHVARFFLLPFPLLLFLLVLLLWICAFWVVLSLFSDIGVGFSPTGGIVKSVGTLDLVFLYSPQVLVWGSRKRSKTAGGKFAWDCA